MGRMLIEGVLASDDLALGAALDRADSPDLGTDAGAFLGRDTGVRIGSDLAVLAGCDVLIDFTRPEGTLEHLAACAQRGVRLVIGTTGEYLWLDAEEKLDAVTALSGSGPAYMFYFMEAMTAAGADMGLSREQAYQLAVATFIGAGELARSSNEPPEILRQRVTSKGGTTYAAITSMEASGVRALFEQAMHAARTRARELGDEFGES